MSRVAKSSARRAPWLGALVLGALALVAPALARAAAPVDSVPMPKPRNISYYGDAIDQGAVRPATRALDLALWARVFGGDRREAANVDEQGQVRLPSTWWQPRVGHRPVQASDMIYGPGPSTGPAPGRWKIVSVKSQGVSRGFQIKDSTGVRFAMKFDPPDFPEMASGADVVASKLFWAAGYNVPDNTIAFFRRSDLTVDPKLLEQLGKSDFEFLDDLLRGLRFDAQGRYRVVASRFLKGKPLGEWLYEGRRKDDPEDLVPHQHRREIRGLYAIAAWISHTDCSARNTLDMYVNDGGRSFVRHHLLDFSGCLGSASVASQTPRNGAEYLLDYGTTVHSLVTLRLPPFKWEGAVDPDLPSVGFIDSKTFDPWNWRPFLPNPAFDEKTENDVRWGARIVAAFGDDLIRAAVDQGRYADPRAVEYLVRILAERRDKIASAWLSEQEIDAAREKWNAQASRE